MREVRVRFTLRGLLRATTAVVLLFGLYCAGYNRGERVGDWAGWQRGLNARTGFECRMIMDQVSYEVPADGAWHDLFLSDDPDVVLGMRNLRIRSADPAPFVGWAHVLYEGIKIATRSSRSRGVTAAFYYSDDGISAAELSADAVWGGTTSSSVISSATLDEIYNALPTEEDDAR